MTQRRNEAFRPSPLRLPTGPSVAASLAELADKCTDLLAVASGCGARSLADVGAVAGALAAAAGLDPDVVAAQTSHAMVMAAWMMAGLPRVDTGHRHAAMLASTAMPPSVVRALLSRLPWDVTAVSVPSGLFSAPLALLGGGAPARGEVASVLVFREGLGGERVAAFLVPLDPSRFAITVRVYEGESDVAGLVGARRDLLSCEEGADVALLMRYVLGALAELMRHRPSAQTSAAPADARRKSGGRPSPTVYRVDRPVRVDCRAQVAEFQRAAGGTPRGPARPHAPPACRVTVRAHWKMQPCGPRSELRELIAVDDYDRGPVDASTASRPHVLVT